MRRSLPLVAAVTACAAAWLAVGAPLGAGAEARPNVLLVTLDTTRADHLGAYGYHRDTSPRLDELAGHATLYEQAWSTSTWTLPAHGSLFTGRYPRSHGGVYRADGPLVLGEGIEGRRALDVVRASPVSREIPTLAQQLAEAGWETAGVVGGPWMKRIFGLDHGFAHWDDSGIESLRGRPGASVSDAAIAWLEGRGDPARPFFLFLNYYDPHGPYADPDREAARFMEGLYPAPKRARRHDEIVALYDGEIRYADKQLGRVLDWLRAKGHYDDTLVIVTADHGELLGEHGGRYNHGLSLYEPELRIPLVVKAAGPPQPGARSRTPIQLTAVPGIVLAATGLVPAADENAERAEDATATPVYAEVYPLRRMSTRGDWRVWIDGSWKLHWSSTGNHQLFELVGDPAERHNRFAREPERADRLEKALRAFAEGLPPAPETGGEHAVDPETRRALESLGYVE